MIPCTACNRPARYLVSIAGEVRAFCDRCTDWRPGDERPKEKVNG